MADLVGPIVSLDDPLPTKLRLLRERAEEGGRDERLVRWAAEHPEIAVGADWHARAWWGAAAGEVVRAHLYDQRRREEALDLLTAADVDALDEARRRGGVIVAAAHLGPPKFLMNWLLGRRLPLLVWTNTRDLPDWLGGDAAFADPLDTADRGVLLVKSALHLRGGGVLLGAADQPTGDRTVVFERLGMRWRFSLGLPALARTLGAPVVTALALWQGDRVRIVCGVLASPAAGLTEEGWHRAWLEAYWRSIEPVLRNEPENLRFLRWVVDRVVPPRDDGRR
ncbi:MAG: hypothetical protein FJ284_01895 [Planctomycetes bacterium]|nr:hypothetical protein [Planctomycetota bacterium]